MVKQSCNIGLAGGEPTIAPFFWKLLKIIPKDKPITITTNGLTNQKLLDYLKQQKDRERFLVQVSIDGLEKINDSIRGKKGAFKNAVFLLKQLHHLNIKSLLSFTINSLNMHQIKDCFNLSETYNAKFSTRLAHLGGAYKNETNHSLFSFNHEDLNHIDLQLNDIIKQCLNKDDYSPSLLVFWKNIVPYYRNNEKQVQIPCRAIESGFVIDLYGNIFPNCPVLMKQPIGNIQDQSLQNVFNSPIALKVKKNIKAFKCKGCWNDCQVVDNIVKEKNFLEKEYAKIKIDNYLIRNNYSFLADFNQNQDSTFLLNGWYPLEGNKNFQYRWTEQEFSIIIPPKTKTIEFYGAMPKALLLSGYKNIYLNIDNFPTMSQIIKTSKWHTFYFILKERVIDLTFGKFRLEGYFCPAIEGQSLDYRKLGIAIQKILYICD